MQVIGNNNDQILIGKHTMAATYQTDNEFAQNQSRRVAESTYMLYPKEREKLVHYKPTSDGKPAS